VAPQRGYASAVRRPAPAAPKAAAAVAVPKGGSGPAKDSLEDMIRKAVAAPSK
jgi:hypothetical protein